MAERLKITLILAASMDDPLRKNEPFMPLSLPLIAGSAPNHDYTLVDMLAGEKVNFTAPVDLVGISYRIIARETAFSIADEFHKRGIPVVLGGAQASADPEKAGDHADAVVVGEGEPLWPILLQDFQSGKLRKVYSSVPSGLSSNETDFHSSSFYDLKNLPTPARHLYRKKYTFDTIFASRGCPIDCDFCSVSPIFGKQLRLRPVSDVVSEIQSFEKMYYLLDDTVFGRNGNHDYYLDLYTRLAQSKKKHLWTGQANLDAAAHPKGREVIRMAAKSGLIYAAIGLESIQPDVMRKSGTLTKQGVGKDEDVLEKMKENIRFIQDQGIVISAWFTIGYEEDNYNTYQETFAFCREMNLIPIVSPLKALQGTRLYDRLIIDGKINHSQRLNIQHPKMQNEQIFKLLAQLNKEAFSLKQRQKIHQFYSKKFKADANNEKKSTYSRVYKSIFIWVLHRKLASAALSVSVSR